MSARHICIHGHFYQPPRENAWLEVIEHQESAAPWHNWNQRINHECYAPNAIARILDKEDYIIDIVNNYSRISFNFGPTLLSWLETADPVTYAALLEADRQSQQLYGGHGSAIAQVHSHLILPLCNPADKVTQVRWGIADFEHRFGRTPEGMWLAETAADTASLEVLAAAGVQFTILAPRQAKAVRPMGTHQEWSPLQQGKSVDTRRPYRCHLPSGRHIDLFFYDGDIAKGVAFEGLLNNGKDFASRLMGAFGTSEDPQLVHIATDGESYGHHHRYGEMALASCLHQIEQQSAIRLTNYGQYLELYPPTWEVQIHENSSWSCVHGVERWRSDCGCHTGAHPQWHQAWRKPLREALDWLRDELVPVFEEAGATLFHDPWQARNDYIEVLLDRRERTVNSWLKSHLKVKDVKAHRTRALRLLEMQRHALLMYTSCGWFFDEISGIETNQILQYANRALNYAEMLGREGLHEPFVHLLEQAPSNVHANGAVSYLKQVIPARVNLARVGMHYAASSLFTKYPEYLEFYYYTAAHEVLYRFKGGQQRLLLGRVIITSRVTYSEQLINFAVLYLGQQNIIGSISLKMSREKFDALAVDIGAAFKAPDLGETLLQMEAFEPSQHFSFSHLFREDKRRILQIITRDSLAIAEQNFRDVYNDNHQLMRSMVQMEVPVPQAYLSAVEFVLNRDLLKVLEEQGSIRLHELERLRMEFNIWDVHVTDPVKLSLSAEKKLYEDLLAVHREPTKLSDLTNWLEVLKLLSGFGLPIDLVRLQNLYFSILEGYRQEKWVFASDDWKNLFLHLGDELKVRV